jgi:hypothetical protein
MRGQTNEKTTVIYRKESASKRISRREIRVWIVVYARLDRGQGLARLVVEIKEYVYRKVLEYKTSIQFEMKT